MSKETYFISVGNAQGNVEIEDSERKGKKIPYFNIFVITPVSDYTSEDYKAEGFKAGKKTCIKRCRLAQSGMHRRKSSRRLAFLMCHG